ncbi:hypothetical protein D3C86_1807780 [compost metagenome]
MLFCSCSLFRKTNKTTDIAIKSSKSQLDFGQLVLKSSDKETQVFTYWTNSGFYQYQHIKEQIDQTKSEQLNAIGQHEAQQTMIDKKATSVQAWGFIGMVILTIVFGFLYRACRL